MENGRKEFLGLLCNLYIIALTVALPLYTGEGYWQLGDTKYTLFRNLSFLCLGGWLIVGMPGRAGAFVCGIRSFFTGERKGALRRAGKAFSAVDRAVICYSVCVVLSAVCSSYGKLAWTGYEGWYMGAVSQLLFAGIYFFISRQYDGQAWALYLGEAALALVTAFGLLHRLGIDPLGLLEGWTNRDWEYSHMLSTLGNINWLCGYYSVALAFLMVHFLEEERRWVLAALYLAAAGAFVLLGIQGSQSGLLIGAVCIVVCMLCGRRRRTVRKRMSLLLTGIFLGMSLMEVLMEMRGEKAAVAADGNLFALVEWYVWVIGAVLCFLFFLGIRRCRESSDAGRSPRQKEGCGAGQGRLKVLFCCCAVTGLILAGMFLAHRIDDNFGSGRGLLWRIALENFAQADGKDKLLGAGPDCYGEAVFNRLGAGTDVWKGEHWEGSVFTNAHCEFLSQLCNVGILGTASYLAVFLTGFWRYRGGTEHRKRRNCFQGSCLGILAISMYGLHSLVSFQQVLNTPLLFLVLGLCEADKRQTGNGE